MNKNSSKFDLESVLNGRQILGALPVEVDFTHTLFELFCEACPMLMRDEILSDYVLKMKARLSALSELPGVESIDDIFVVYVGE